MYAGRAVAALVLLFSTGCARYADFTLPPTAGGDPQATYVFEANPQPVITRGDAWDSHDVLNPSVVRKDGSLLNVYSGFDGQTWRSGAATSKDGLHWVKAGIVLEPDRKTWEGSYIAANGSAVVHDGHLWYWYVAGGRELPRIGLRRQTKEPNPVLDPGPYMSWDERGVADPYVIRIEPYFYMYYLGQDRARRQRIGLARSRDGVRWEKLRSNPILQVGAAGAFDENGTGEPAVWNAHGFYWMLYTGRDATEKRRLGLARSTDGVRWTKLPPVFSGSQAWNEKVLCDATVLVEGGRVRVWFGGGDKPRPDEDLDGQIGYGELKLLTPGHGLP